MRAIWNNEVIAESDDTIVVEGNHYFPPEAVRTELLRPSKTRTYCPWKGGEASYYSIEAGGRTNPDAAWYYPRTAEAADHIKGRIAFWKGVEIVG
ncbi:MAG: DUF427 domain-containing protein [Lysobacterales bacterium]|jgi:uncharacterized protein (DUF427 family)